MAHNYHLLQNILLLCSVNRSSYEQLLVNQSEAIFPPKLTNGTSSFTVLANRIIDVTIGENVNRILISPLSLK
jgi:hypothetical protein